MPKREEVKGYLFTGEREEIYGMRAIARICYEANRAYCMIFDDFSLEGWDDAPEWQRQSYISGVRFRLENPEVTARQMHENWMEAKVADGWVYGDSKDAGKKTHPCLVGYDALPDFQKRKDVLFSAIVKALTG